MSDVKNEGFENRLKSTFTDDDKTKLGAPKRAEVFETERHVYRSPFFYTNVQVGNFLEWSDKGLELLADEGFITIEENKPIAAVTVVGSGCSPRGYSICEYWKEGEKIDAVRPLTRRQRIGNLNGTHISGHRRRPLGKEPNSWTLYRDAVDFVSKLTGGFYGSPYMGFYENTACFRVERTHKMTIRGGCMVEEDPNTDTALAARQNTLSE